MKMLNVTQLSALSEILNITALCKRAGLNRQSINSKIRNKRELTVTESEQLLKAITSFGLKLISHT